MTEANDDDSKYEQLQDVYTDLIAKHERVKERRKNEPHEDYPKGEASGLIHAIGEIEDLLNEWHSEEDE